MPQYSPLKSLGNQRLAIRHLPASGKDADDAVLDADARSSGLDRGVLGPSIRPHTALGMLSMFMMCQR